ncbi:hypothetical protein ABEW33_27365 [Priestia megaterium]
MKFKDLFDLEKIKEADPKEVLDEAVKTIVDLKPIELHTPEMNELAYAMPEKADFNIVDEYVKYEENKETSVYEITVPSFDERKLKEFMVDLYRKDKYDCFPERGFYVTGTSKLIVKPLGLVRVEMYGYPVVRVDKDIRYTQTSGDVRERGYKENLYFYYNYEDKALVRVYSDKLEDCKRDMKKRKDALQNAHPSVQEYIKREELLSTINRNIYKLVIPYLPKLKKWNKSTYNDGEGNVTIGTVRKYLTDYEEFLDNSMSQNLKVKLIYSNVTTREYTELLKEKKRLKLRIETGLKGLDTIKAIYKLTPEQEQNYKLITDSLVKEENTIVKTINSSVIPDLEGFKEMRPSEFPTSTLTEELITVGYIGYDLETREVFPTIMQLQYRTSLTENKEDFRTEAEYTARIIEELKKIEK